MQAKHTWMVAALLVLLMAAGCRTQMVAPPPSFDPPEFKVIPVPLPAPTAGGRVQPVLPDQFGPALTPKAKARPWKYLIIHHSDTPMGSAARFDRAHRARGWECLGYDFVIGNGTETRDGLIEAGPRWIWQMDGAHTGVAEYNKFGIGICLVGNFEESRPTKAQMDSLARLCAHMMKTYNIPANRIVGHRDCKPTTCPGRNVDLKQLRALASAYLKRQ